jgi:methyl-accepting chemotaxis protein
VGQQDASTQEIAQNVNAAAKVTSRVADSMGEVTRAAVEAGAVSGQVLTSAKSLASGGHKLKQELDRFLSKVRATNRFSPILAVASVFPSPNRLSGSSA